MDTSTPVPGSLTGNGSRSVAANAKIEDAALAAHRATDAVADKATEQVDRLSGTAHRAVNKTADAASSAAEWTATLPEQAKEVQAQIGQLKESAATSIRARPFAVVGGALVIGYLVGKLGRN
jgi:hypothetical protein